MIHFLSFIIVASYTFNVPNEIAIPVLTIMIKPIFIVAIWSVNIATSHIVIIETIMTKSVILAPSINKSETLSEKRAFFNLSLFAMNTYLLAQNL